MGTRGQLRNARSSLSLYFKVYGAVAAPRFADAHVSTPSLTSWRER